MIKADLRIMKSMLKKIKAIGVKLSKPLKIKLR